MTLQEIEDRIARLESAGEANPADTCEALYSLEGTLRRTLWAGPYRAWARELVARADREVRRLCQAHRLLYSGIAPRFPSYTDSAGNRHAEVD